MAADVAIILLNWNAYEHTSACLNSLSILDYPNYKVIVVDNNSVDDSLIRLEKEFKRVHFIQNHENLGFTGGNNVGICFALENNFDTVLLLNNDTLVEKDFLTHLMNHLDSNSKIGAVQPKIMYNDNREMIWSAGGRYSPLFTLAPTIGHQEIDNGQFNKVSSNEWISCCAFLVRSSILREIGLEDEIFFYGCFDDVDLSFRIRKAGFKLSYCPDSVIYHDVMSAVKSEEGKGGNIKPFFHYLATRNHWFFIRKHTKWIFIPTSIIYQFARFFVYVSAFAAMGRLTKLKAFTHGFAHGIIKPLKPAKLNHQKYILKYK